MGKNKPPGRGKKPRKRRLRFQVAGAAMGAPDVIVFQFNQPDVVSSTTTASSAGVAPAISLSAPPTGVSITCPTVNHTATANIPAVTGGTSLAPVYETPTAQVIANGAALDFTPTLFDGTPATSWTAANRPAWMNLNTTTGRLSGTATAGGKSVITLTGTNSSGNDVLRVTVHVYTGTTNVTQAWRDAQGTTLPATQYRRFLFQENVTRGGNGMTFGAADQVIDLNGYTLTYGTGDTVGAAGSRGIQQFSTGARGTLYNGSVVSGANGGLNTGSYNVANFQLGFYGTTTAGITIDSCYITAGGPDAHAYLATWDGASYLTNTQFICDQTSTVNRHQGPACVHGGKYIRSCYLEGGNVGINRARVSSTGEWRFNVISNVSHATNGYALFFNNNATNGRDNVLIPTNGRGIICPTWNCKFENNVIMHWEAPNAEFGSNLQPPALRLRYDSRNITYTGNKSLGIAGASGALTGCATLYLTNYCDHPDYKPNTMTGNTGCTIQVGASSTTRYANNVALETQGRNSPTGAPDVIDNNTFWSNLYHVRVDGYDGQGRQQPIKGNTFEYKTGDEARAWFKAEIDSKIAAIPLVTSVRTASTTRATTIKNQIDSYLTGIGLHSGRKFWYIDKWTSGDNPYTDTFCTISDSTFGAGIDTSTWDRVRGYAGEINCMRATTSTIRCLDQATSNPIANTNVTYSVGSFSQTLTTDSAGDLELPIVDQNIHKDYQWDDPVVIETPTSTTLTPTGYNAEVVTHASVPGTINFTAV